MPTKDDRWAMPTAAALAHSENAGSNSGRLLPAVMPVDVRNSRPWRVFRGSALRMLRLLPRSFAAIWSAKLDPQSPVASSNQPYRCCCQVAKLLSYTNSTDYHSFSD